MHGIEPVITYHLEVLFWDMLDENRNEIQNRDGFFHIRIILVLIVVESHIFPIVGINAGGGNDRPPKVAADTFDNSIGITEIWFGIDIETVFILFVNGGFVKTRCLWVQSMSLKDILAERSMQYLLPQVGQNLEWQRKGTNLSLSQWEQAYIAPP